MVVPPPIPSHALGGGLVALVHAHGGQKNEWTFEVDERQRAREGWAVRRVAGMGAGAFALRSFRAGELLFAEAPLLSWPAGLEMTADGIAPTLSDLVASLAPGACAQFSTLCQEPGKHGDLRSFKGVWQTNALPSRDDGGASMYANASLINHSCRPCLNHTYTEAQSQALFVVEPMVKQGEQLTIAYISQPGTREQRRERLRDAFGFDCACALCSLEGAALRQSDVRQRRMVDLEAFIDSSTSGGGERPQDEAHVLAAIEEMLLVQKQEGLPITWGQRFMMIAIGLCERSGNLKAAARWAWRAQEATRIGGGADSPVFQQLSVLSKLLSGRAGLDADRYAF